MVCDYYRKHSTNSGIEAFGSKLCSLSGDWRRMVLPFLGQMEGLLRFSLRGLGVALQSVGVEVVNVWRGGGGREEGGGKKAGNKEEGIYSGKGKGSEGKEKQCIEEFPQLPEYPSNIQ